MDSLMRYISRIHRCAGTYRGSKLGDEGINNCQHIYIFHDTNLSAKIPVFHRTSLPDKFVSTKAMLPASSVHWRGMALSPASRIRLTAGFCGYIPPKRQPVFTQGFER